MVFILVRYRLTYCGVKYDAQGNTTSISDSKTTRIAGGGHAARVRNASTMGSPVKYRIETSISDGSPVRAALSELARRGVAARTPLSARNGFPVFQVPAGTPGFGPDEAAREFLEPGR